MTISPAPFRRFEKSILMENFEVAAKCADGFLAQETWGGHPKKNREKNKRCHYDPKETVLKTW